MKKSAIIFSCLLLVPLASGISMGHPKKVQSQPVEEIKPQLSRENMESGLRVDPGGVKHCPISDVNHLKCESGSDFLPYQHPADADGPWWYGRYKGD